MVIYLRLTLISLIKAFIYYTLIKPIYGGEYGLRTADPLPCKQVLFQLSLFPIYPSNVITKVYNHPHNEKRTIQFLLGKEG